MAAGPTAIRGIAGTWDENAGGEQDGWDKHPHHHSSNPGAGLAARGTRGQRAVYTALAAIRAASMNMKAIIIVIAAIMSPNGKCSGVPTGRSWAALKLARNAVAS
jgi:hypothetical protein